MAGQCTVLVSFLPFSSCATTLCAPATTPSLGFGFLTIQYADGVLNSCGHPWLLWCAVHGDSLVLALRTLYNIVLNR